VRVTEVECVKLPFEPVIVSFFDVTVLAFRLTEMVSVELPEAVTGLGLKLALVLRGNPPTLRLTELDAFTATSEIV
jgi:hypothetical protein